MKIRIIFTLIGSALVAFDQLIKLWALESLRPVGSIVIIPGLFNLSYVENRGAAFGIMQGHTRILAVVTCAIILAALFWVYSGRLKSDTLSAIALVIIAGGTGNFVDRAFRGFVVDYLDFSAIFNFPVFNLADCCVVVGTSALIIYVFLSERRLRNGGCSGAPGEKSA